jgi:iron(III) transport system permease protein
MLPLDAGGTDALRSVPRRRRVPLPLTFGAAVAGTAVLLPIFYLVVRATERGWGPVADTLLRPRMLQLVLRSVGMAAAVTLGSLVVGVGGAWLVTRTDVPGRRLWRVLLALPLAVPSYVAAWAWIALRPQLAGPVGAFVVLTSVSFPYVYLPVAAALRNIDPALEDAARSLGRRPLSVLWGVTLRQTRPAAVGGALLVALYALSDFGAVSIMRYESLTHALYRSYRASFDRTPAAVLGCVLVALAVLLLVAQRRRRGPERVARVSGGAARVAARIPLGRWRWPAAALLAGVSALSLGVPAWSLAFWLRRGTSTTDWSRLVEALGTTAWVAAAGAVLTVVVALPVGILSARYGGRFAHAVTTAAYASHSLPGIVVALSLVFFGIRFAAPLYQRTPMLLFAYVVLFLSLAVASVHNSVAQAPPRLDEMSRCLGRSPLWTWVHVTMRIAAPGIGAGTLLVFLTIMKELPATLLLRPIGIDTLATRLWGYTEGASYAAAAPFAAAIVLLAAVPTALLTGAWMDRR